MSEMLAYAHLGVPLEEVVEALQARCLGGATIADMRGGLDTALEHAAPAS
jgi:hypothetical protein